MDLYKYIKERNKLFGSKRKDISMLKFLFVKEELPKLLNNSQYNDIIIKTIDFRYSVVLKVLLVTLSKYKKLEYCIGVKNAFEKQMELEQRILSKPPTAEQVDAGIQRLDIFGSQGILRGLVDNNPMVFEDIKKYTYGQIFDTLLYSRLTNDYLDKLKDNDKKKNS